MPAFVEFGAVFALALDPAFDVVLVVVVTTGFDDELDPEFELDPETAPELVLFVLVVTGLAEAPDTDPEFAPEIDPDAEVLVVCDQAQAGEMTIAAGVSGISCTGWHHG